MRHFMHLFMSGRYKHCAKVCRCKVRDPAHSISDHIKASPARQESNAGILGLSVTGHLALPFNARSAEAVTPDLRNGALRLPPTGPLHAYRSPTLRFGIR